jgi:hypothetical protein
VVAYCKDCDKIINQYCDRCGDNFGVTICEKYACGGTMRCPTCNGANLSQRKEFGPDPYDFARQKKEGRAAPAPKPAAAAPAEVDRIRICPYCGKNLEFPEVPKFCPFCQKQILH